MRLLTLPFWETIKSIYVWSDKNYAYYFPFDEGAYWATLIMSIITITGALLIAYLIYLGIYEAIDRIKSYNEDMDGVIVDKKYMGETSSSGIGTAMVPNSGGGVGVGLVSTSSSSPEEFLLFVNAGKVYKIKCSMQQYYSYNIFDKIKFSLTIGGVSKNQLDIKIK